MEIEFIGAAAEVTGSMHLVRTGVTRILLDCGLYQGRRRGAVERNRSRPVEPASLDAVVLSHAHIDHSGALPMLVKRGFRGPIYCTTATRDLCAVMLEDAAMIQEQDAKYVNDLVARGVPGVQPVQPLYNSADVATTLGQMVDVPYHQRTRIAPDVEVTLLNAGHVLGSAVVCLDVDETGESRRLVFTGDLGRYRMPLLRDPEVASQAHVLITESTYGDRYHPPVQEIDEALAAAIRRMADKGGMLLIPAFALERAQELIYVLKRLRADSRIPQLPVYVDSPLTVRVTDVFNRHPECFDREAQAWLKEADSPFSFDGLKYVHSVEESKAVDAASAPRIVISASGMCEFGRVLHHLRTIIGDPNSTILITGFQAQHTLGRRLVERRRKVSIFGVKRERRADVVVINGLSAHADRGGLLAYAQATREAGPLREVILVHGEPPAQAAFKLALEQEGFPRVSVPEPGERIRV